MIKEKLMKALKTAAADYNGGMSANMAVTCAAEAWDFNEKQAERLVEMFNTLAALNKEKDASDPTGSCELASKEDVIRTLFGECGVQKAASVPMVADYSFYGTSPEKTNETIEARAAGVNSVVKAASAPDDAEPDELKVSQRSLYKIISGKIDMLKSAASAADDVVRNLRIEIERGAIKIAKAIESPYADPDLADMFKAACEHEKAVSSVSEYSTKVAESTGGRFSKMNVFDSSKVEDLLKTAEEVESNIDAIPEYERKRDFYMSKAAEAENEMLDAVGLLNGGKKETVADMFRGVAKQASPKEPEDDPVAGSSVSGDDAGVCVKIAKMLRDSGVDSEAVARLAEDLEKDAAINLGMAIPMPKFDESVEALRKGQGIDNERKRIMNVRRSIILADLMSNDPIIRDADPNVVTEAYKTMVMTSPRVSLDKAQVRSFLRSSVNSVAISPNDAKVIADVDKGVSLANVDRLTHMDSSIKDSNV